MFSPACLLVLGAPPQLDEKRGKMTFLNKLDLAIVWVFVENDEDTELQKYEICHLRLNEKNKGRRFRLEGLFGLERLFGLYGRKRRRYPAKGPYMGFNERWRYCNATALSQQAEEQMLLFRGLFKWRRNIYMAVRTDMFDLTRCLIRPEKCDFLICVISI